jgi:glycosyltransferase involved in cell wall biosynthesis
MGKVNDKTDFFKYVDSFAKDAGVNSLLIKGDISSVAPAVTIAIPTYKRPEFIKCAIDSALAQKDFDNYEVVVVDNDPERDTETEKIVCAIDNPKLKYYKNAENLGMFGNMNRCIKLSRTKWIAYLHDDDILSPDFLYRIFGVVGRFGKISMLCSRHNMVVYDGKDYKDAPKALYHKFEGGFCKMRLKDFSHYYPVRSTGCVFQREKAVRLGGFNPDFYPTSDYVFSAIYSYNYGCYDYNRYLYNYRMGLNESANPETYKKTFLNDYYLQLAIEKKYGRNSDFITKTVEANTLRNRVRLKIYGITSLDFANEIITGNAKKIHAIYNDAVMMWGRGRKIFCFIISKLLLGVK